MVIVSVMVGLICVFDMVVNIKVGIMILIL